MLKKVVVWGDSITKGIIWDDIAGKYVLSKQGACLETQRAAGIEIINRSKMGMTVTRGRALMEADLKSRIECQAALIEFGGNDSDFNWREISQSPAAEHLSKTGVKEFERELRAMTARVKDNGIVPVLATLPPIEAQKYFDFFSRGLSTGNIMAWLGDIMRISRYHEQYSDVICRVAEDNKCPLIDWRAAFAARGGELFCSDGIHPNNEGQLLMAQTALKLIDEYNARG